MTMHGKELFLSASDCQAASRVEIHNAEVIGLEPAISLDAAKLE